MRAGTARQEQPLQPLPESQRPPLTLIAPDAGGRREAAGARRPRIQSIDALRGLIMIIMALDHDRDFIHAGAQVFSPEDLSRTSAILFLTRWVTHICAPVFMFTAGMGAYFWMQRGRTTSELSRYLVTRGLWLVGLEFTVVHLAFNFNFGQATFILEVIWALGWCMVLLAALVHLPRAALAAVSVAAIVFHNVADGVDPAQFGPLAGLWEVFHQPGPIVLGGHTFLVAYPLIPWIGVMGLGFCVAPLLRAEPKIWRPRMAWAGVALVVAFIALRAINRYGDPRPWTAQATSLFTVLGFLRTTKYPPSLAFLLMTMGPALLLLAWFGRRELPRTHPLVVFGRVPLFYFLLHLFLLHAVAIALLFVRYGAAPFLFTTLPALGGPSASFPSDLGYPLWVVYVVWVGAVVVLYPVCRWFGNVKQRRGEWWLTYL